MLNIPITGPRGSGKTQQILERVVTLVLKGKNVIYINVNDPFTNLIERMNKIAKDNIIVIGPAFPDNLKILNKFPDNKEGLTSLLYQFECNNYFEFFIDSLESILYFNSERDINFPSKESLLQNLKELAKSINITVAINTRK